MEIKVSLVGIEGYIIMVTSFFISCPRDQRVIIMEIKVSQFHVIKIKYNKCYH